MWLLDTSTLELRDFVGANIPPYAILSHTWSEDEVTFRDMRKDREAAKWKAGYAKVQKCCENARQDGHQFVWIDTCCIDKRSSAELSEAINSMYRWYQDAKLCYAYLADVPSDIYNPFTSTDNDRLSKSRWFTRGWTLQELIAPRIVQFLARDWKPIGIKAPQEVLDLEDPEIRPRNDLFMSKLETITGIEKKILRDPSRIRQTAAAQRMAWAARRETTREEDLAYSLMGLFGVNIPILYGEGEKKAFRRLQLEIIQMTTDQSIFVWRSDRASSGLLAESPRDFANSGLPFVWQKPTLKSYSMTNIGLLVELPTIKTRDGGYILALRCWVRDRDIRANPVTTRICLFLHRHPYQAEHGSEYEIYRRVRCKSFEMSPLPGDKGYRKEIYVLEDEQYEHLLWIDGENGDVQSSD